MLSPEIGGIDLAKPVKKGMLLFEEIFQGYYLVKAFSNMLR